MVNQSYEWVERAIVFKPELKNWQSAVRDGFLEAGIGPYNGFSLDHLVGTKIGGSTFDSTGRRHSAADLLSYAKTSNIRVAVHAIVERVLLATSSPYPPSKPSAIGVVYRDQRGGFHHAMLCDKGEVLLSAGSLRLASTDVEVNPIVRFNYFRNPGDVERCVNGTRKIGDVLRKRSMEDFKFREWVWGRDFRYVRPALPVNQSDYVQMADLCRRTVSTIWRYHESCVVGKVVHRDSRVIGIGLLRVVDGSTLIVQAQASGYSFDAFGRTTDKCLLLSKCFSITGWMLVKGEGAGRNFFRCSSTKVVGLTFGSRNQVFLSHSLCTFSYFIHTF